MIIEEITVTAFQQHTRIVGCEKTRRAICIDPGDDSKSIVEAIDKHGLHIAFCDMVHSYTYGLLRTRPFRNYIDLGCFIAKTAAAKSVGFRDKSFSGDATYFEDLLKNVSAPVVGKVAKVLMVHN